MNKQDIKNIAIIGGGPGGLMLGLLLQQQGFSYTIFEKAHENINSERGGSLDIHEESGQLPLKVARIYDKFRDLARYEGEDTRILDKKGAIYLDEDAEGEGGRPEIDRGELCDIILEQINPKHIKYGYTFQELEQLSNGQVNVKFTNGESERFDLVIGSDGAFSNVRPYLTNEDIQYSGISMIELNVENVKNLHPDLYRFNKQGKVMALGDDQAILAQLNGDGRIKVYVSYRMDSDTLDEYKELSQPELKQKLKDDFKDWDSELQKYIDYANDEVLFRRIYMLPIGLEWNHNSSITLIGDAAHLMSPFAGEGVNMALYDAYLFAEAIKNNDDVEVALKNYEREMYKVSKASAEESQSNLNLMFSKNAAKNLGDLFLELMETEK
ncbi:FAD-dependent oxidoreductase [Priestia megaterium]